MNNNKLPAFLQKEKIGSTLQIAAGIYGAAGIVLTCINTLLSVVNMLSRHAASSLPSLVFSNLYTLVKICIVTLVIYAFGALVEHICSSDKKAEATPPAATQEPGNVDR
ncbi:MAG: hypothetical protein HFE86_02550 [Clostridiales bacterium]|nr:hypothetical protein [Clostridiales bacterium]